MDGSSRQVVVNTTIEWPNGITLDFANRFVQHPLGTYLPSVHRYHTVLQGIIDGNSAKPNKVVCGMFVFTFLALTMQKTQ